MKIAIGADHGGFNLKENIKEFLIGKGIEVKDFGTHTPDSVDYALISAPVSRCVASGECELGILICGTGIGMSLVANKVKGIRAACCSDYFSAKFTRLHNDANILCMGERVVGQGLAQELVEVFISTEFEGGRHERRVDQIRQVEEGTL